jgi:Ca2+-transporting ATPase
MDANPNLSPFPGLDDAEAKRLLAEHGPNDLNPPAPRAWLRRWGHVLGEPTLLALLAVLALYIIMGSMGEAVLLGFFVLLVLAITYIEESRTEAAVAALGQFASPRAVALRGGAWTRVPGWEVVPGDLLRLAEGDRVPADGLILEAHDFRMDESLLTGESAAVWKRENAGDDSLAWAGSLVLGGQALARVQTTGLNTRVGQLSRSLADIRPDPTPFQRSADTLVRALGWVGFLACAIVVLLSVLAGHAWTLALLNGLTLAIGVIPEELPMVLTVFMAMGARRMALHKILVRRLPAVETLGAISVLAVDKTGTLTENSMTLTKILPGPGYEEGQVMAAAARACDPGPFDPMEQQILRHSPAPEGELLKEYELQGTPPRMGHLWSGGLLSMKGSLEGVLEHCVPTKVTNWARDQAILLARQGLRVLAVAEGQLGADERPVFLPGGLRLLGLLAFHDPLRAGVPEALAACHSAGIRVVMLTGDAPETAMAIAREAGFVRPGRAALGAELSIKPGLARDVDLFARMGPEHKQTLIKSWTAAGEVVAMTGDGVNDAPALTQAQVGVAMGLRGTDVAREAASVVLVDDSFTSLVEGVRQGRETTARILKAAVFVLAVHVPIVGLVLLCLALDLPPLVTAAQVAFLELFIGPACSVVFERAGNAEDVMRQPPRDPRAPLLPLKTVLFALLQGGVILALVGAAYLHCLDIGLPVLEARSLAFTALMLADFALCWTLLSPRPFWRLERWNNAWFWAVASGVMGLMEILRHWHFTAPVLGMQPLDLRAWGLALVLGLMASLWHEVPKLFKRGA